jgi:hypothetical protein
MNLRVRRVTGCSRSAIFARGESISLPAMIIETGIEEVVVDGGRCRLQICGKLRSSRTR